MEDEVDALDKLYRAKHMNRLNIHSCSIDSGIIYLDLLTNLERISDHSASIAKRVIKINQNQSA
nr:PhoU domain-containing protein [Paraclostridium sp. AKS73]